MLEIQQRHELEMQEQIRQAQLLNAQKAQSLQPWMTEAMVAGSSACVEQIRVAAVEEGADVDPPKKRRKK